MMQRTRTLLPTSPVGPAISLWLRVRGRRHKWSSTDEAVATKQATHKKPLSLARQLSSHQAIRSHTPPAYNTRGLAGNRTMADMAVPATRPSSAEAGEQRKHSSPQAIVEPAQLSDVPNLSDLFMKSFGPDVTTAFAPLPDGLDYISKCWEEWIARSLGPPKDGQEAKVLVVRDENGQIASSVLFWIYHEYTEACSWVNRWPSPGNDSQTTMLRKFNDGMERQHKAIMGSVPHAYGEFITTDPRARGRAYGALLEQEWCKAADRFGYPSYCDATMGSITFHGRFGFVEKGHVSHTSDVTVPLVRAPGAQSRRWEKAMDDSE